MKGGKGLRSPIYLDAAASTPLAPEAFDATVEALRCVGNPAAAHADGYAAARLVNEARVAVAELAGVGPASVVFTASATESNNLALRGIAMSVVRRGYVTTTAEHPSTTSTVQDLVEQDRTRTATFVGVLSTGEVDLDVLDRAVTGETALISIHAASNESGVIQPIEEIVGVAHERGGLVHVDASQLMAWGPTSLLDECDLVTISSHKMHGPQGAAALIVNRRARAAISAQVTGGGQERGLRSGTTNVAAIAGFGAAARLAIDSGAQASKTTSALRAELLRGLEEGIGGIIEHSAHARRRVPGILNVAIGAAEAESVESEALLARVPGVAASTGSACHAGVPGPSPVLLAMGISEWEASRSIRLSLSRYTTADEISRAVAELSTGYAELGRLVGGSERKVRYA